MQRDRAAAFLPRLYRLGERAADDLVTIAVFGPRRCDGGELAQVGRSRGRLDRLVFELGLATHLVHQADVVLAQNTATGQ